MDKHIEEYFLEYKEGAARGNFHKVIVLHGNEGLDWEIIREKVPNLCRGWYELSQLSPEDRVEFTRDFWFSKLPYTPNLEDFIDSFFSLMDDIGIYITQKTFEDPFEPQMVYSLAGNCGFYRGGAPASEDELAQLQGLFPEVLLPDDYLKFLSIHNGFCKTTDSTGIAPTHRMSEMNQVFQHLVEKKEIVQTDEDEPINPKTLIPFYESFGMPYYQCFWTEWYPAQEMGNVYYSLESNSISDTRTRMSSPENMSFPTFLDWLMFYLETVE